MCLGVPGKLVSISEQDGLLMGKVDFGGIRKDVCLAYTPEAQVGQYVLVHVGFALSVIDEQEAEEIFSYLRQIEAAGQSELPAEPESQSGQSPPPSP
jgi:hydrogenase expression/formation protein HypC